MGPHSSIGGARQIQLRSRRGWWWRGLFRGTSGAPRGGASLMPPGGASNSLAPALNSCASLAWLVLSFIACFVLLVIVPSLSVYQLADPEWWHYSVSPIPLRFSDICSKRLGSLSPNSTVLLYVPVYAIQQIFIQLSATLTKLCHIKRDHPVHNHIISSKCHRPKRTLGGRT